MKKTCAKILIMALVLQSVYLTVNGTNESAKAATLNLHNPTIINGVSTWDCVYFGTYWQNDTNGDGVADQNDAKEPIKWRVLQVDGDDVFLMSDKILDYQWYKWYNNTQKDVTWEKCSLRTWLYSSFYRFAFSTEEQKAIKVTKVFNDYNYGGTKKESYTEDKIYLLSLSDVTNRAYGFSEDKGTDEARMAYETRYIEHDINDISWREWWIRNSKQYSSCVVWGNGYIATGYDDSVYESGVRPVLHLSRSLISKLKFAGTVSSDGVVTEPTVIQVSSDGNVTESTVIQKLIKGKKFNYKGNNYKITKLTGKKGKLTLVSVKNKKTKKITIPKEVKKYGYKFTITQIGKNVFTRCKKLKRLTIKSRTITKIGKNKFPKKCKIVVPQAMKKKYTRLLKKK